MGKGEFLMRIRRRYKRTAEPMSQAEKVKTVEEPTQKIKDSDDVKKERDNDDVKKAKPAKPFGFIHHIIDNPNFALQIIVILITLTSENMQMDRRIAGMTTTVDKVKGITEVINSTMQSIRAATEAPKQIRRLLE